MAKANADSEPKSTSGKKNLAEHIKNLLFVQGKNIAVLARELGVNQTTANYWFKQNLFRGDEIANILRRVGMPEDLEELKKEFDFRIVAGGARKSRWGFKTKINRVASDVNLMPLLRAVVESGISTFTTKHWETLLLMQAQYSRGVGPKTLTPSAIRELFGNPTEPESQ